MYSEFILFLGSDNLKETDEFYRDVLNLQLYKDQKTCMIYKINDKASIGFCSHINKTVDKKSPIITLIVDDVDKLYETIKAKGIEIEDEPKENKQFNIYHFFLKDNNGYTIEIQRFL